MDLIYMTDVMAYQSMRTPLYDKYAWEQQAGATTQKSQPVQKKKKEKEPCKICQERQRRSLMKYIRSKSHDHSEENIQEEEEEEKEEEEEEKEEEEKEEKGEGKEEKGEEEKEEEEEKKC